MKRISCQLPEAVKTQGRMSVGSPAEADSCFYPHMTWWGSLSFHQSVDANLAVLKLEAEPGTQEEHRAGGKELKGHTIEREDILRFLSN